MKLNSKLIRPLLLALAAATAAHVSTAHAAPPGTPAAEVVPHRVKRPFPQITLPERQLGGQRALDALGSRLPEVADWYGKSPDEFRALLLNDKRMRLDQRGRLFVVEELDQPLPATPASAASTGLLDGTLAPLDQTFLLHSRAGAKRTIYLNFKGATLTGTAWNGSGGSIIAPPFDTDGLPYSFSQAELERIQYIWQRVAEDYAPFDVDVTTEAVPLELIARAGSTDQVFGTTVVITTRAGVYSCSCGGIAYVGVFDDSSEFYKPALVFYDALGSGNEKYVAEAISHEAGHNMGLSHDGTSTVGYYQGQGSGATGWAPIMGVGYYQPLTQWSKGEYAGANNVQDDYAVMQSNGLPLRADDHGNTPATATVLVATSSGGISTATATGVIERPGDIDMFAFTAAAGAASFKLSPAARSANLDAVLSLRNAAGSVLATANPADALDASLSLTLPAAGTYYLAVQGTGKGDPLSTGYSNYGSLGQYTLSASYPGAAGQAPKAVIAASTLRGTAPLTVNFSGSGSSDADGSVVAYDWNFGDSGSGSGATLAHAYATPGSYSAQLRVTDNSGLSSSSAVTVVVDPAVSVIAMRVSDIAMSLTVNRNGNAQAGAAVKVLGANGLPVVGATVTGNWSGIVSRSGATAVTDASGVARFGSPSTRVRSGSFVFGVTGVSLNGYSYAPATNTETSDSIAR
ncbi:PKD domain-containing protein [Roseateles violae]|uniref:PKD domain-containing protein n=1 Tax=Roseateles violae TaxID=3058042 RepID=A0ABT8DN83_9BURK|nr:PKD domain-containing protein [Pelomonas sp. PFR6]MDN3919418.1 PKD domain-containing protein [Pelomonas sp. PFR6]